VLLAIGCREYDDKDSFDPLPGADTDAEHVYSKLVEESGHYEEPISRLFISPDLAEVRSALDDLFDHDGVDVVSFFFAGHGVVHRGVCYLCPKDAMGERLPTTALPIGDVLAALADVRPRQINIVMDSCESGGAMLDLANILKPENLIGPESPNVSFLAASAPDQSSYGDACGGYATTALMAYLNSDKELRSDRPFLDLVELGRRVSDDVGSGRQRPVAWGLNLHGEDEFAENPFYEEPAAGRPPLPVRLAPTTAAGAKVREYREALWHHYHSLPTDPDYSGLAELLRAACEELEEGKAPATAFLRGVASSFRDRAEASQDLLAPSDALACCAVALLPLAEKAEPVELVRQLLSEKRDLDAVLRGRLIESISSDRFALLNEAVALADFFLLPIRISRVLGWLAAGVLADDLLGTLDQALQSYVELARRIIETYRGSLVAMSDSQAPHVYLFAKACDALGEENLASEVLSAYFESLEEVRGFVARGDAEPSEALRYLVGRMAGQPGSNHQVVANPVQFLPALLLPGEQLGLDADWNGRLIAFDGKFMDVFVPADHREFGMPRIPTGTNHHPRLGQSIWRLQELTKWFESTVEPAISADKYMHSPEPKTLCVLASYLFSDRLPYFL
jgi:hypothetical protein